MSRLSLLGSSLLRHRVVLLGRRLASSEPPHQNEITAGEQAIGLVVFFTSCLIPAAYILSKLEYYKQV
ncbi:cytochrome c oxidase subunit 8C, mitochondrial [Dipodomys merriami]|uniref:cytochrome c oxidase subunit 8C, mitochondrial n=1 Tax=Dipodomys merriami TaxID=94247 RepID=UPI003855C1D0